jgi:hypothetical protein
MDAARQSGIVTLHLSKELFTMTSSLLKRMLPLMSVALLSTVALSACNKPAEDANTSAGTETPTAPATDAAPAETTAPAAPESSTDGAMAPAMPQDTAPQDMQPAPSYGNEAMPEATPEAPAAPEEQQQQQQ